MEQGTFFAALTAIAGALVTITTGVIGYLSLRHKASAANVDELTHRVAKIEAEEAKCQEERVRLQGHLVAAMEREGMLRQALPQKLIDGVDKLIKVSEAQNVKLDELKKAMGSDPDRLCRAQMHIEQLQKAGLPCKGLEEMLKVMKGVEAAKPSKT